MSEETAQEPVPGSDEYNEKMAALARERRGEGDEQPTEQIVHQMPEGGHEKFWNAETGVYNWQAHAVELQYRMDQKDKPKAEDLPPPESGEAKEGEVTDVVTKAGLSMEDLGKQIAETGTISDDAMTALMEQGIPRDLITSYVENAKLAQEASVMKSLEYVGGKDEWQRINAWANENLSGPERDMYNDMLKGPQWTMAVDALKQRMGTASPVGTEGRLETGGAVSSAPVGYKSKAEMVKDMNTNEYRTDPAFRARVMQKMQYATWEHDK